jgi:hypothetical protein
MVSAHIYQCMTPSMIICSITVHPQGYFLYGSRCYTVCKLCDSAYVYRDTYFAICLALYRWSLHTQSAATLEYALYRAKISGAQVTWYSHQS